MGPSHSTSLFAITLHNVVSRQDRYALYCVHDIDLRWCMISAKADAAVLSTFHFHMVLAPVFSCTEEVTEICTEKHSGQSESQNVELPARALVLYQFIHHITKPLRSSLWTPYWSVIKESTNHIMIRPQGNLKMMHFVGGKLLTISLPTLYTQFSLGHGLVQRIVGAVIE